MTLNIVQLSNDPQNISTKLSYPKNIHFSENPIYWNSNFEPPKMARAYVCMKISESVRSVSKELKTLPVWTQACWKSIVWKGLATNKPMPTSCLLYIKRSYMNPPLVADKEDFTWVLMFYWIYLLNELGKRDILLSLSSILSLFRNEFNTFKTTRARMLDSIYHMTLRLLWNLSSAAKRYDLVIMYATLLWTS